MFNLTKDSYFKGIRCFIHSKIIPYFIIAIGIILYLRQYLNNRCLWHDEAILCLDIIRLPVISFLHQPLPYKESAPFGFLVVEKLFVSILGTGEYALRLYPFIAGITSLWLFFRMLKTYLNSEAVVSGLFVFAVTPALVYYSSETKTYYTDILFALISYVVIAKSCLKELDWEKARVMGVLGAFIIWFSFPVIFVLLGIGVTLLIDAAVQRDETKFLKLGIIYFFWSMSFILCYIFLLQHIAQTTAGDPEWQVGYISFTDIRSWLNVFINILNYPIGIAHYLWLGPIIFFIGLYSFFKERKSDFLILFFPLLFTFLASGFHKYSCRNRLALFLLPIILIIIAKGIDEISVKFGKFKIVSVVLLTGILFYGSFVSTCIRFIKPEEREDARASMSYVKENIKRGDVIYVYPGTLPTFEYYYSVRGFLFGKNVKETWPIIYPLRPTNLECDLKKLQGLKRVWILYSDNWTNGKIKIMGPKNKDYLFRYLFKLGGKMVDQFTGVNAGAYLFDLSKFSGVKNNEFSVKSEIKTLNSL